MALFREQSDVSVRPAVAGDEQPIADIQLEAWRTAHADVLGEPALSALDRDAFAAGWTAAITAPPGRGHRVLVACDGPHVVGFVAIRPLREAAPDAPPDAVPDAAPGATSTAGEVVALEVRPSFQRGGHGSRLLAAAVDLLREDGLVHVATWVLDGDPAREQFLTDAGLGPDGATRTLATGVREVVERRWVAEI